MSPVCLSVPLDRDQSRTNTGNGTAGYLRRHRAGCVAQQNGQWGAKRKELWNCWATVFPTAVSICCSCFVFPNGKRSTFKLGSFLFSLQCTVLAQLRIYFSPTARQASTCSDSLMHQCVAAIFRINGNRWRNASYNNSSRSCWLQSNSLLGAILRIPCSSQIECSFSSLALTWTALAEGNGVGTQCYWQLFLQASPNAPLMVVAQSLSDVM